MSPKPRKSKYTPCTAAALNSQKHNCSAIVFYFVSYCSIQQVFVFFLICLFPPGQSHLPTFPPPVSCLLPPASYRLPPPSLYSCVSQLSCHKNELNLSPSVQTTIDRVGTFRKTNRHLLSLLGIGCMCVCAHVHVYC